jgi:hypothetical protein
MACSTFGRGIGLEQPLLLPHRLVVSLPGQHVIPALGALCALCSIVPCKMLRTVAVATPQLQAGTRGRRTSSAWAAIAA